MHLLTSSSNEDTLVVRHERSILLCKCLFFNLYVSVNSYGHVEMVRSTNHTFFLGPTWQSGLPVLRAYTIACY